MMITAEWVGAAVGLMVFGCAVGGFVISFERRLTRVEVELKGLATGINDFKTTIERML